MPVAPPAEAVERLAKCAMERLVRGHHRTAEDYEFAWAGDKSLSALHLFIGTVYEYARESETVRALAWLDSRPEESREPWELRHAYNLGSFLVDPPGLLPLEAAVLGARATANEWWEPVINGISQKHFDLGELWVTWKTLASLGEFLADDLPFQAVLRERRDALPRADRFLAALSRALPHARTGLSLYPQTSPPLRLVSHQNAVGATMEHTDMDLPVVVRPTRTPGAYTRERQLDEFGGEEFLLRINWRDFTNQQLRLAFEDLIDRRPIEVPEPRPKDVTGLLRSRLQDLAAWRITRAVGGDLPTARLYGGLSPGERAKILPDQLTGLSRQGIEGLLRSKKFTPKTSKYWSTARRRCRESFRGWFGHELGE